jgi:endonuclease/exonuclease/phosphatase family metal-dependent hydrolase
VFHPLFGDFYGLAMFIKDDIEIIEEGEIFVYKHRGYVSDEDMADHARNIQFVSLKSDLGLLTVINFHGLWNGKGKGDSDDRLLQSDNILSFLKTRTEPVILAGDFNLAPDTESIKKLEAFGLRNLIREYGVTSTRTSHYSKPERYADYIFLSNGLNIKNFSVLPDEVSDHVPLALEIDI